MNNKFYGKILAKAVDNHNIPSMIDIKNSDNIKSSIYIGKKNIFKGMIKVLPPQVFNKDLYLSKDAYVDFNNKTENFGKSKSLFINKDCNTFISFNINDTININDIKNIYLTLNIINSDNDSKLSIYATSNWYEYDVTYLNQPKELNKIMDVNLNNNKKEIKIDLTEYIKENLKNNKYNFDLLIKGNNNTQVFSRKSNYPPKINIQYYNYESNIKHSYGKIPSNIYINKNNNNTITGFINVKNYNLIQSNNSIKSNLNVGINKLNEINTSININRKFMNSNIIIRPTNNLKSKLIITRFRTLNSKINVCEFNNLNSTLSITNDKIKSNINIFKKAEIQSELKICKCSELDKLKSNIIIKHHDNLDGKIVISDFKHSDIKMTIRIVMPYKGYVFIM